ncbi:succinylarginine dihydrolase [Veillonella sp.]|uniref:succinylarginine dihydrolase n=1 Tax=Veillonella sp. TaxID=1926307 RepID=UPI0025D04A0B|nr:succinylarginine dihydrolase [Veillonella sp.]
MVRALFLFLLIVVLSPINAFADDGKTMMDIERSLNNQIASRLQVPAKVLRTKIDRDYSFDLQIKTDIKGRITSVELDPNEHTFNDEIYLELVQTAKNTVWNIGYIDVKEEVVISIPFHFIISAKEDVN